MSVPDPRPGSLVGHAYGLGHFIVIPGVFSTGCVLLLTHLGGDELPERNNARGGQARSDTVPDITKALAISFCSSSKATPSCLISVQLTMAFHLTLVNVSVCVCESV